MSSNFTCKNDGSWQSCHCCYTTVSRDKYIEVENTSVDWGEGRFFVICKKCVERMAEKLK